MTRCSVHYSGRVQGVGFRATAAELARQVAVTGFVRNLRDGRVELVAEGDAEAVERLLTRIAEYFRDEIAGTERRQDPPTGEFDGFEIRF